MSRRSDRVAEAIRREVSVLIKDYLRDPRIGFVTVTEVTITEDLRYAVIYYSVLGNETACKKAAIGLKSALPLIRSEISHRLDLRFAPQIVLKLDDTYLEARKIEDTIQKMHNQEENKKKEKSGD